MHRFHLPPEQCHGPGLILGPEESHHAATVLRIQSGEEVTVLDGAGRRFQCRVAGVRKREVSLETIAVESVPRQPFSLTLVAAVAKPKAMDWILQKAVELGADRIEPIITDRSISRPPADEAADKQSRWQVVAIEAMKQCGAAWLTHVETPRPLADWLRTRDPVDLSVVASLYPGAVHPRAVFESYRREHGHRPMSVAALVGPEGDFTESELAAIIAAGARPVTLGDRVLRCETAALATLAILHHEFSAPEPA